MAMNLSSPTGRSRGRRGLRRAPMAEINVTPLVDVMLVLLVIFMITAPFLASGVQVELPKSRAKPISVVQEPLNITVDKEGLVYIDSVPVKPSELAKKLEGIAAAQSPEHPRKIMLRGDTDVDYGSMMKVMGELNHAGLNSVNMVTIGSSKAQ